MKKICLIVALGFVSLFVAGCSIDGSASSVAKGFLSQINSGKYEKAKTLIYKQDENYYSEDRINDLIKKYEDIVKDVKKVKVLEQTKAEKNEYGLETVSVTLEINDGEKLIIDTVKFENNWYIYEDIYYGIDVNFIVPQGTTLKVNGEEKYNDSFQHISNGYRFTHTKDESIYVNLNNVNVDLYVIQKYTDSINSITFKGDETVTDVIVTAADCGNSSSDKYEQQCGMDVPVYYDSKLDVIDTTGVEEFVRNYVVDTHASLDRKDDYSSIQHLFDESVHTTTKADYDNISYLLMHAAESEPSDSAYYSDFKLDYMDFDDIKMLDDDNIVVIATYAMEYLFNSKNSNNAVNSEIYYNKYKLVLSLKKSGDTYKVTNALGLFLGIEE